MVTGEMELSQKSYGGGGQSDCYRPVVVNDFSLIIKEKFYLVLSYE